MSHTILMSKHINIIARSNGVGLDSDVILLTQALQKHGHKVTFSHCRSRSLFKKWFCRSHQYDANIFLERVFPVWFGAAKKNILIPNQERFPKRHISRLSKIDHIFCKSHHAHEIFSNLGNSTQYIGFTSKDIRLKEVTPDYGIFFHLAGRSTLKGTETILKLWSKHPDWPTLTIVQHKDNAPEKVPENVHLIAEYLPYNELISLANKHGIHLCPSQSEGWGHYIVEAMSCGAIVITTDAAPMNELISDERGILVPFHKTEPRHLGTNFFVDPELLEEKISTLINGEYESIKQKSKLAREWFLDNDKQFITNLNQRISEIL